MEERERRQSSSASGLRKLARVKKLLTPPEPVRSALMPPRTGKEWRSFFLVHLPILQWVWHYQWRYLLPDFISGMTVAVVRIPQGLASALLAELPPVIGLYTNFVPVIFYSILCTSRHLSVGTFAVVSLMVGNAISKVMEMEGLAPICLESDEAELFVNGSGRYGVCEEAGAGSFLCEASNFTCGDLKLNVAVTLSFMTGCITLR